MRTISIVGLMAGSLLVIGCGSGGPDIFSGQELDLKDPVVDPKLDSTSTPGPQNTTQVPTISGTGTPVLIGSSPITIGSGIPITTTPPLLGAYAGCNGTGLYGTYYSGTNLLTYAFGREDGTIDFDWTIASPAYPVSDDSFSARWTGSLQAPLSGNYAFHIRADDGVRLYIDDVLIIDQWNVQAATDFSTSLYLAAGLHSIRLEYFENSGLSSIRLMWQLPGSSLRNIIPRECLFNNASRIGPFPDYYPPVIRIDPVPFQISGSNPNITLTGTTSDTWGDQVTMSAKLNGVSVPISGTTSWSTAIVLQPGINTIEIEAKDRPTQLSRNRTVRIIEVIYTPS